MFCSAQAAKEEFICGDYVYAIGRAEGYAGTAVVTEYIGSDAHVVIPYELDRYAVDFRHEKHMSHVCKNK